MADESGRSVSGLGTSFLSRITVPENRVRIVVIAFITVACAIFGAVLYNFVAPEQRVVIETSSVDAQSVQATAGDTSSPEYRGVVEQRNQASYEKAGDWGGVSIPQTFEEARATDSPSAIDTCNCTMSDEEFAAKAKRLGLMAGSSGESYRRVADSDIYLADDSALVSKRGLPFELNGMPLSMDASGQLMLSGSAPAKAAAGGALFLSKTGEILNETAARDILSGRIMDDGGKVILSTGRYASKDSGMFRAGSSDIFVSADDQLLTADSRPIMSSGVPVFLGDERVIRRRDGTVVPWESQASYLGTAGALLSPSGEKLRTPGLLFSYLGTMFNNDGRLQEPLIDLTQIGDSKLYIGPNREVLDEFGAAVSHRGQAVRLTRKRGLRTLGAGPVVNRGKAEVQLERNGSMSVEVGRGSVHSGVLLTSTRVAYQSNGRFVTDGALARRGASDLYVSGDNLVVDDMGRPLLKGVELVFVDPSEVTSAGAQAMKTEFYASITDLAGKKLYLSDDGSIVYKDDARADDAGFVVGASGGVVLPSGMIAGGEKENLTALTDPGGSQVFFKGQRAFVNEAGVIVDEHGDPILHNGKPVYYKNNGLIEDTGHTAEGAALTDADGNPIDLSQVSLTGTSHLKQLGTSDTHLTASGLVTDSKGRPLLFNGKAVRRLDDGSLVDADGNPVRDSRGRRVYLSEDGRLLTVEGEEILESILQDADGVAYGSDGVQVSGSLTRVGESSLFYTKDGLLTDARGVPILYNGEKVLVGEGGRLRTASGRPVLDESGSPMYVKEDGSLVNRRGEPAEGYVLTTGSGTLIDSSGHAINEGGMISPFTTNGIYKTADRRLVTFEGVPVRHKKYDLETDSSRALAKNKSGAVRLSGKKAYVAESGVLVDEAGEDIRIDAQRVILDPVLGIVTEGGEVVGRKTGSRIDGVLEPIKRPTSGEASSGGPGEESAPPDSVSDGPGTKSAGVQQVRTTPGLEGGERVELTPAQLDRLQKRYDSIAGGVVNVAGRLSNSGQATGTGLHVSFNPYVPQSAPKGGAGDVDVPDPVAPGSMVKAAGSLAYSILQTSVNTDYTTTVMVSLVGIAPSDPLFEAKLMGSVKEVYGKAVIEFSRLALPDGTVHPAVAIALDPTTTEAGMAADVDRHLWYRYGGLFLASLVQGIGEAASLSADREEVTTGGGVRHETAGLDGSALAAAAMRPVGEEFTNVARNMVSRPVTVMIPAGVEMAVLFIEPVVLQR